MRRDLAVDRLDSLYVWIQLPSSSLKAHSTRKRPLERKRAAEPLSRSDLSRTAVVVARREVRRRHARTECDWFSWHSCTTQSCRNEQRIARARRPSQTAPSPSPPSARSSHTSARSFARFEIAGLTSARPARSARPFAKRLPTAERRARRRGTSGGSIWPSARVRARRVGGRRAEKKLQRT